MTILILKSLCSARPILLLVRGIIVKSNNKKLARLESIRYLLNQIEYAGKDEAKVRIFPDPEVVTRFHRNVNRLD